MAKFFTRFYRLMHINFVLARYNLDEMILAIHWLYPIRFFRYLNPWHWTTGRHLPRGVRVRLALETLGPIFVKAGQILSTRIDFLPEDIALELTKLQDRVKPFPGILAKQTIEESFKCPVEEVFSSFEIQPLASASIAQVHAATLSNGKSVVVKILRPKIKNMIDRDLDLLMTLAKLAERYWRRSRSFKPKEIVNEIAHTLYDELDLLREGANASQLRRNFLHSKDLYIPEIFWAHSRPDVLVMERIEGIPVHNIEELRRSGVNLKKVAECGIDVFFTQVFRDNFFHADLHPGNLFICAKDPENPKYIAVDFGITGSLNSKDQRYLAENMLAFLKRDYRRVAELHISSGWLPPDTRTDQFEGAIRAVCEPIFERPLKDISFGQLLFRLFQTARRFHINIQPQLILLQKSLLCIESLSRQLYPEIDLWKTAEPSLERWLKNQIGVKSFLRRIKDNIPYWSEKLPEIPNLIFEVLSETQHQQERKRFTHELRAKTVKHSKMKSFGQGAATGLLIGGAVLLLHFGNPTVGWALSSAGLAAFIASLL
ncbi:MAG TPA: ubiquinone biosynthesis regulatory protein kinase UbiB [Gammaproteobacteria bacterium]|nr:ubiquinone biosynthesis regulatory protein kinase UbiB [Gammaproteobacteria bacterium]